MQEASAYFRNRSQDNIVKNDAEGETILCLDSDQESLQHLALLLERNSYHPIQATTPGEALHLLITHRPSLLLTEIQFSDIDSSDLLQSFRKIDPDIVIIIHSIQKERRNSRNRRLDHIFEFIEKPARAYELIGHLKRGLAFHREKRHLKEYVNETRIRIKQQLEWLIWNQQGNVTERIRYSRDIVNSIKHSITQGNGVGSLITMVEMLQMSQKPSGEGEVSVNTGFLESLVESANTVRNWLEEMDSASRNLARQYNTEVVEGDRIEFLLNDTLESMDRYRRIKNHVIRKDPFTFRQPIQSNEVVYKLSLRELLTNAFKFSPDESPVRITYHRTSNSFSTIITNRIMAREDGMGGIPPAFESRVFEPFFRLNNINDDRFHTEMYGMGTGLTIIQAAVNQVGGKLFLYEAHDPEESEADEKRVVAELIFPIAQNKLPE